MIIQDILEDIFQKNVLSYEKNIEILKEIKPLIIQNDPDIADELESVIINSADDFINFCKNYSNIVSREVKDDLRKKFIQIFSNLIVKDPRETDQEKLVELIHRIILAEIAKNPDSRSNDSAIFYCLSLIHHIDDDAVKILLRCLLYLENNKKISDMTLEPLTDNWLPSQPSSPIREILPEPHTPSPRKNVSALGNFVNTLARISVINDDEKEFLNKILLGSVRSDSDCSTNKDQFPKAPLKTSAKMTETTARFFYKDQLRSATKIIFHDQSEIESPKGEGKRKSGLFLRYCNDPNKQINKLGLAKICVNNITNILTDLSKDECYAKLINTISLSAILNLANYIGGFQSHSNDDLRKCFKMKEYGDIELSDSKINDVRKLSREFQKRAEKIKILSPQCQNVGLRIKRIGDFIGRQNIERLCNDVLMGSCNLAEDDGFLNSITCELSQQQCDLSSDLSDSDSKKNSHVDTGPIESVRGIVRSFNSTGAKKVLFPLPQQPLTSFSRRNKGAER